MASPQLENGYTRIANELLEAIARTPLSGSEFRVLFAILRLTYGMQKVSAKIHSQTIKKITGMVPKRISEAKKALIDKKIVVVPEKRNKYISTYRINKNYDQWATFRKNGTTIIQDTENKADTILRSGKTEHKKLFRKNGTYVPEKRNNSPFIPILVKENNKENTRARNFSDVPEKRNNGKRQIPPDFKITDDMIAWFNGQNFRHIDIESATAEFIDYWKSEGKMKKDWMATWRNGMRNKEKWSKRDSGKDDNEDAFKRFLQRHQADDDLV